MSDVVEGLRDRYWSLVVNACEWRAYGVSDPELMAQRVFATIDLRRHAGLDAVFRAVDRSVAEAYAQNASGRSMLSLLQGGMITARTTLPPALQALSSLREGHRRVLQLAYWDELEPAEICEVLGVDLVKVFQRLADAETRFRARLDRLEPDRAVLELAPVLLAVKPGDRRRAG